MEKSVYMMDSVKIGKIPTIELDGVTLYGYRQKKDEVFPDKKAPFRGFSNGEFLVVEESKTTGMRKEYKEGICFGFSQNCIAKKKAYVLPKGWDIIEESVMRSSN